MNDKARDAQTQATETTGAAAGEGETPISRAELKEAVDSAVKAATEGITKKYNSEFAGLRRRLTASEVRDGSDAAELRTEVTRDAGLSPADVSAEIEAAMRLGELRSVLPEAARKRFDEQTSGKAAREKVAIAEILGAALSDAIEKDDEGERPEKRARDARPKPTVNRGGATVDRSAVNHPTTRAQAMQIAKHDPARWAQLKADPDFNVSDLR